MSAKNIGKGYVNVVLPMYNFIFTAINGYIKIKILNICCPNDCCCNMQEVTVLFFVRECFVLFHRGPNGAINAIGVILVILFMIGCPVLEIL
jgi:hypothetical protein